MPYDRLRADLSFALASFRRNKAFAAAAMLTLALGIGIATAMMSAAYGVLLRPLPYAGSDRIVQLWEEHPGSPPTPGYPPMANTTFYAWREHLRSLEQLALFGSRDFTLRRDAESMRVHGAEVSPAVFDILRATPQAGRLLIAADDVPGHHDFVVLSDRLWRQQFGADQSIVGRTITVDGRLHQVVGVAQPGFSFPDDDTLMWTPFDDPTLLAPQTQGGVWLGNALGRMKPGATLDEVRAEGTAAARGIARPPVLDVLLGKGAPVVMKAKLLVEQQTDVVRPAMLVLVIGVVIVLLAGCVNVTNLLLARGITRERELALRVALGASRGRLIAQLLAENALLAIGGGAAGFLIGAALLRVAVAMAGTSIPRLRFVTIDLSTFAIAMGLTVAVALIGGLAPALSGRTDGAAGALRGGDGAVADGFRGRRAHTLRRALLVGQLALAVVMLVAAGLLGRSFANLMNVDPGYSTDHVLAVSAFAPDDAPPQRIGQFIAALVGALRADGRVVAAGAGNMMPFNPSTTVAAFDIPAAIGNGQDVRTRVAYHVVTPGYAEALGLRLRAGRLLDERDAAAAVQPVIVNDEFVREYLSADRVLGLQLPPRRAGQPTMEIVGVVAAQRRGGNDQPVMPEMYVPAPAAPPIGPEIDLIVKTTSDPLALAPTVRELAARIDPSFVIGETIPLDRRLSDAVRQPRLTTAVLWALAVVGLVLAAVGVYGVMSFSVLSRSRELAVRAALGAERRRLFHMILGEGLMLAVIGVAVGLVGASFVTQLMTAALFGVTPLDTMSFLLAPLILVPVVTIACIVPAISALRADPLAVLRQ